MDVFRPPPARAGGAPAKNPEAENDYSRFLLRGQGTGKIYCC